MKAYLVQIGATAATVRTISIDQPNEHSLAGARAMANRQLLAEFDKAYKEASGAPGPRTVRFVILDVATGGVKIELDVPKAAVKPQRRGTRRAN